MAELLAELLKIAVLHPDRILGIGTRPQGPRTRSTGRRPIPPAGTRRYPQARCSFHSERVPPAGSTRRTRSNETRKDTVAIRDEAVNLPEPVHPAQARSRPASMTHRPERTGCPSVADVKAHAALYCDVMARLDRLEQKLVDAYRLVAASRQLRDREPAVRPCEDRPSASRGNGGPARAGGGPHSPTPA